MTQDDLETRLARAQAELKLFRSVFDAIPDFIGLQDRDHRIVRYNEAAYRFLDLRPEQVQGRRCFELIGNHLVNHIERD